MVVDRCKRLGVMCAATNTPAASYFLRLQQMNCCNISILSQCASSSTARQRYANCRIIQPLFKQQSPGAQSARSSPRSAQKMVHAEEFSIVALVVAVISCLLLLFSVHNLTGPHSRSDALPPAAIHPSIHPSKTPLSVPPQTGGGGAPTPALLRTA